MNTWLLKWILSGLLPGALLISAAAVFPADLTVSNAVELQSALNEASRNAQSDRVILAPGVYSISDNGGFPFTYRPQRAENFSISIIGAGSDKTFLDGAGKGPVAFIDLSAFRGDEGRDRSVRESTADDSAATVTVEALCVRNGVNRREICPSADGDRGCGSGGLSVETNSAGILVRDCTFKDNAGMEGGGLNAFSFKGRIDITGSLFAGNRAVDDGSGASPIQAPKADKPQQMGNGGGAFARSLRGRVTFSDCRFSDNLAENSGSETLTGGNGGGLRAFGRDGVTVSGSTFTKNRALNTAGEIFKGGAGGGLYIEALSRGDLEIKENRFEDNTATMGGGGASIHCKAGKTTVLSNTFSRNEAGFDGGGAKAAVKEAVFDANIFESNVTRNGDGGGLHASTMELRAHGNRFIGNRALFTDESKKKGDGGGAHIRSMGETDMRDNTFEGNEAMGQRRDMDVVER
ncbi:MAG: right-handed parallel beta-helix repeat-containing protein [Deltaproteobacteria bacterium]|nr:right-handed parallel beta-helix repeat-containing protein [Deltaproteobacteria bacterium]